MADIASSDVTYTLVKQRKEESGHKVINFTLAFGDGAKTYPSGGIPLTAAKLGCPNQVLSLKLIDAGNANGFMYKYDLSNNKIRIYQTDAHTHSIPAGTDAGGGTSGASTAAASDELGNVAVVATTIKIEVVGW